MTDQTTGPSEQVPGNGNQVIPKPVAELATTQINLRQVAIELEIPHDENGQPTGEPTVKFTAYSGLATGGDTVLALHAYESVMPLAMWDHLVGQVQQAKEAVPGLVERERAARAGLSLPASMSDAEQVAARARQAEGLRS